MAIQVGDKMQDSFFTVMGSEGPQRLTTDALFAGKKVVLFGVPGAFTPGCTLAHLPGFVVHADAIKEYGVDTIACVSVNDVFVMAAWGKASNADDVLMLADGNGEFVNLLGLAQDASQWGMGMRSQRFSMIVDHGIVSHLNIDPEGVDKSSAETLLKLLQ